jgi:lysine 2,3-aminomutase
MELWQQMLRQSIDSADDLVKRFNFDKETAERLNSLFHIRINPYYLNLIRYPGDPIWLQCIPDAKELEDDGLPTDPLNEDNDSPVPSITHRYPDRVLFLVTSQCSMYCRFCTRKRKVSDSTKISMKYIQDGLDYIKAHPEVRDVIVSGGDPLMLTDVMLEKVLGGLREIPHVEIIRVHTKMPCVLPQRITPELVAMMKKYQPLYVNVHFNHPWEITPEARQACDLLADAGFPLGNQMVLMKGVNDDAEIVKELNRKLLMMRVRPYYIYQADMVKSTNHFRTPIKTGLEIMDKLRGHTSGLAVPYFVIDAPGGGGKIPILPQYVLYHDDQKIVIRNYKYEVFEYDEITGQSKVAEKEIDERFLRKKPSIIRERRRRASKSSKRRSAVKVEIDKPAEE